MDAVENMFSVREVPWHGLGDVLPNHPESKLEVITAAGFSDIGTLPLYVTMPDGTIVTVPDHKATYRVNDGKYLATVGGRYAPVSELAMVDFLFDVLDTQDVGEGKTVQPETGGHLQDGKVAWLCVKVNGELMIGGIDPVSLFILIRTSHDGSLKFGVDVTPVRVVCANTLNLGMREAKQSWSTKHTSDATKRIDEARKTLNLTWEYKDQFEVLANNLIDQEFTKVQFESMVTKLFPAEDKDKMGGFSAEQYRMIGVYESSPTIDDSFRATKWGALNAVREWDDWGRRYNEQSTTGTSAAERRTMATVWGKNKDRSQKVLEYLTAG